MNTHLVTHGVDYDHFRRALDRETAPVPELDGLPRPVLGFHGLIADWVDLKLIAEIARTRSDWSIVLIGRVDTDVSELSQFSNIRLLGHRPYALLPGYLRKWDVALLPFICNDLTRAANPLKLREYLSAGLPVIAAPLPEIMKFDGLVMIASTADEYVKAITALGDAGRLGPSLQRSQLMESESWDRKVAELERHLAVLSESKGEAVATKAVACRESGGLKGPIARVPLSRGSPHPNE